MCAAVEPDRVVARVRRLGGGWSARFAAHRVAAPSYVLASNCVAQRRAHDDLGGRQFLAPGVPLTPTLSPRGARESPRRNAWLGTVPLRPWRGEAARNERVRGGSLQNHAAHPDDLLGLH